MHIQATYPDKLNSSVQPYFEPTRKKRKNTNGVPLLPKKKRQFNLTAVKASYKQENISIIVN